MKNKELSHENLSIIVRHYPPITIDINQKRVNIGV